MVEKTLYILDTFWKKNFFIRLFCSKSVNQRMFLFVLPVQKHLCSKSVNQRNKKVKIFEIVFLTMCMIKFCEKTNDIVFIISDPIIFRI